MMRPLLVWTGPLLLCLALTPLFPALDLGLARYFYDAESGSFSQSSFLQFLFNWACWPANLTAGAGLALLIGSIWSKSLIPLRRIGLMLCLTQILCSGLLVNTVFKEHWNRPRPRQVVEFGGDAEYRQYYQPQLTWHKGEYRSFPSGHGASGFYFLTLVVLGWRLKDRRLVRLGCILTLLFAGALGVTRIAQGGHFFSDVLFAGVFMWLSALGIDWLLYRNEEVSLNERSHPAPT